jgi:hypothetical protein
MIEAAAEPAEAVDCGIAEAEGLVGAIDGRLEFAGCGVDPLDLRHLARFVRSHDDEGMQAAHIDDAKGASQAAIARVGAGPHVAACPVGPCLACESGQGRHIRVQRVPVVVRRHSGDERDLVGLAAVEIHEFVRGHAKLEWDLIHCPDRDSAMRHGHVGRRSAHKVSLADLHDESDKPETRAFAGHAASSRLGNPPPRCPVGCVELPYLGSFRPTIPCREISE